MSFRVSGKNLDVGDALRERINARIGEAMSKYFDGGYSGHVTIARDGSGFRTECAVHLDSKITLHAEGMAPDAEGLSVLQDSFWELHALQCGYCTPGMLIAAHALLLANRNPTEYEIRDAIGGNLCRCTGYKQIVDAIALAAERLRGANLPPPDRGHV